MALALLAATPASDTLRRNPAGRLLAMTADRLADSPALTPARTVDFNADLGESFGLYHYGADEELLPLLSSANVACGFHAGDPSVMRRTVSLARHHGVAVGAHVGFPDLLGFGRRRLLASPAQVKDYVTYQIGALQAFLHAEGLPLHHVKPHGALYMMALEDPALARAIAEAVCAAGAILQIYTIRGSALDEAANHLGLQVVPEFFSDRGYHSDGAVKMFDWTLEEAGGTPEAIGQRVVRMLQQGTVPALGGGEARVTAQTVCVHSDTPGAPALARAIRQALATAGIQVGPCRQPR
jgi:UPF0271 protein